MKPTHSFLRHQPPRSALDLGAASSLVRTVPSRRPRRRRRRRRAACCRRGTTGRRSRRSSTSCAPPPTGQSRATSSPEDRIAVFDQDGTLWVEHPMYTQVVYCLDRVPAVVAKKPELKNSRAFQDRAVGQPGGDRQAPDAGPREDPRRDADRHDGGGVQRRSEEMARDGQASALEPALHRAGLSADARSVALPARQRLQDLHRDRRRPGLRARLRRAGLRHSARAGGRHRRRHEVRLRQGRQAVS